MKTGVYRITCVATGKIYVGSTARSFAQRWRQHRHLLSSGRHPSPKLQAAWKKYGSDAFRFDIVVRCVPDRVLHEEQLLLDQLRPAYNTAATAGNTRGFRFSEHQREALKSRPQSVAKKHRVHGEELSIPDIARKYGIAVVTLRARLSKGLTGDDLVAAVQDTGSKTYMVRGELLTRKQIAEKYSLPPMTVYTRIAAGWAEDDLANPRLHRGKNSGE